jgi:hypothetical protein
MSLKSDRANATPLQLPMRYHKPMSITVTIPEASQQFAQLIGKVLQGEEIIICENNVAT